MLHFIKSQKTPHTSMFNVKEKDCRQLPAVILHNLKRYSLESECLNPVHHFKQCTDIILVDWE